VLQFIRRKSCFLPWILLIFYFSISCYKYGEVHYIFPGVVEIFFLFCSISILSRLLPFSPFLIKSISFFLIVPILLQVQFLITSGDYISVLALWNTDSAGFITTPWMDYIPFVIFLGVILFFPLWCVNINKISSFFIFFVFIFYGYIVFFSSGIDGQSNKWRAPISSLVLIYKHYESMKKNINFNNVDEVQKENILKSFFKEDYYGDGGKYNQFLDGSPKKPNVIVFFIEGMSANIIDAYGGKYGDLTPNLDEFSSKSIKVENYYNHTAATFRGLRGQLTSSYEYRGGTEKSQKGFDQLSKNELIEKTMLKITTLPNVLRKEGYSSYFFSPHYKGANLNTSLEALGFDKVFTRADDKTYRESENSPLTDKELVNFLIRKLPKLEKPYFIGIYNFGTHLTMDSPDVKYKDGGSIVLNRFHNIDAQFGRFMKYYFDTGMDKNTIVIFTSDHASFPAPEFTKYIDTSNDYFVDKIPLMIYWGNMMPHVIDANGANSIDFAPTIMNLLKIKEGKNYFMGCSLFEKGCTERVYVSALGDGYFLTEHGHVYPSFSMPAEKQDTFNKGKSLIQKSYKVTNNN